MSRIFDALRNSEAESQPMPIMAPPPDASALLRETQAERLRLDEVASVTVAGRNPYLVPLSDEHSLGAEKFRVLATRLKHLRDEQNFKLVQVTSSVIGEGKSLVALNLALTLAQRNQYRVLLIEGDMRKPTVNYLLGLEAEQGLGDWWREEGAPQRYLLRVSGLSLWVMPAGTAESPQQVLQSGRTKELITQLSDCFDWVIIDSPPVLPVADANLWARIADGTLLVVREGKTPKRALERALEGLDNPKLLGVVLNDAADKDRTNYYDRYYRTYGKQQTGKQKGKNGKAKGASA